MTGDPSPTDAADRPTNRVRILPEHVANCIAAGEVVERPASVVKEFVENSLDAGARRVEVEIVRGGRRLVRVVDDGSGMSRDEALLALERHATSKIRCVEDIDAIRTLGFRGEALPSIVAVSRFVLRTRETDALAGTEIRVSGGKLYDVNEAGTPAGTLVEARDLFFNLPARRKFLRSVPTETAQVVHAVTMHALAHPGVAFRLVSEGRPVLDLEPAADIEDRIREIFGADTLAELVRFERDDPAANVGGYAGRPSLTRANRSEQRIFVNGRPVESRAVGYAIGEAYRTLVMKGRYPVVLLFLDVDPARVDVNIHPAKREVRFRDSIQVQRAVLETIRAALQRAGCAPRPTDLDDVGGPIPPRSPASPSTTPATDPQPPPAAVYPAQSEIPTAPPLPGVDAPRPVAGRAPPPSPVPAGTTSFGLHILGTIAELYVVAESDQGLVLIDQHAAHERVLFDRLRRQLAGEPAASQRLLMPHTVEFDARDASYLQKHLETLRRMGFEVGEFGPKAFLVEALPPYLLNADVRQVLRDVLDELRRSGGSLTRVELDEETLARFVCRHAVKARDPLTMSELTRLLEDLQTTDLPYTCPHGRPTMILISAAELEKKFGRRGGI